MLLGVDTGGTFTDFVLFDGHSVRFHKVLSTPSAPEKAILQGIEELGLGACLANGALRIVHGTTVATNAALEGKGAQTVFITNNGLEDLLIIGRQARERLYDLAPPAPDRPFEDVPSFGIAGRLSAQGDIVEPLEETDIQVLVEELKRVEPEAVAISLLFSWLDNQHEQAIKQALSELGVPVSISSDVLPISGEYERGVATWLNAWLGPLISSYLQRLESALSGNAVSVMQSHGGTLAAGKAADYAVNLLLSGPAGGLCAAQAIGDAIGMPRLMTFDMGGTSTDVALLDGSVRLTLEGKIRGFPVSVPMVEMHTIGAGGGSIARLDSAGMLHVGPESAGADPGPACYGRGGTQPTVTDANAMLGRLPGKAALGGALGIDPECSKRALTTLLGQSNKDVLDMARGVIALANEHMVQALRVISVQRGLDPADFTLMSFGGAGGLHVCALADALKMRRAVVPAFAGVLSALGLAWAQPQREKIQALPSHIDGVQLEGLIGLLQQAGFDELKQEGCDASQLASDAFVDVRYQGQGFALSVPWKGSLAAAEAAFHDAHELQYGHRLTLPVTLVNVRVKCVAHEPVWPLPVVIESQGQPFDHAIVDGIDGPVPIYQRQSLGVSQVIAGPALIVEAVSTTWLAPQWQAIVHQQGHLILERLPA